jgi:hypothetical protein
MDCSWEHWKEHGTPKKKPFLAWILLGREGVFRLSFLVLSRWLTLRERWCRARHEHKLRTGNLWTYFDFCRVSLTYELMLTYDWRKQIGYVVSNLWTKVYYEWDMLGAFEPPRNPTGVSISKSRFQNVGLFCLLLIEFSKFSIFQSVQIL